MAGRFFKDLAKEFQPRRLIPSLVTGLIVGAIDVLVEISLAALIFSGDLSAFVANGIGITLFSGCVVSLVVALTSSCRGVTGGGQDVPAAILALVAGAITAAMPAASPAEKYATVVMAISLTSLVTGIGFLLMGTLRLGGLIRYIPYPVIGGFLAGTGWVIVDGAFSTLADVSLRWPGLAHLFQADAVVRWLPGVLFGVVLYLVTRKYDHFLIIPGLLAAACLIFYVTLWATGTSLTAARSAGWLLGSFPGNVLWPPLGRADFALVDWQAIFANAGSIGTVLLVSAISVLLNASGLELTARQDMDLDRELRSSGLANLLAGLGGGIPGYQTLSLSALSYRLKADTRLFGVFVAAICGLALLFGGPILALLPRPVVGGLLLYTGLSFLGEWVYDAWFKFSHGEYAIILLILVAMNTLGMLPGVGLGILCAVVLFVLEYSRIKVVKHDFSGESFRSNVDRPKLYNQLLHRKGGRIHVFELQGFLFFGTANRLLAQVRQRVNDRQQQSLRFLLLDFRQVNGLDASAMLSFNKIKQLAQGEKITLLFTHLSPVIRKKMDKEVLTTADAGLWQVFDDLNHGMAWCEEQIIADIESTGLTAKSKTVLQQLGSYLPAPDGLQRLKAFCEKIEAPAGQVLITQEKLSRGLFFLETGGAEATLGLGEGKSTRLRKMSAGAIVGEVSVYASRPATATVTTDQPSLVYLLSNEKMEELEKAHPDLAAALHKFMAQLASERLVDSTDMLEALLK